MAKYEIRDVVSDYGIYEDGELKLVLNSRSNAEYIKAILEVDGCRPNAATVYSPRVEAMSDEECMAVFRLCCVEENRCNACPLRDLGDGCFLHIDRRVMAIAERALKPKAISERCDCEKQREEGAARYIDADALIEELKSLSITVTGFRGGKCYWSKILEEYKDRIFRIIDEQATADVAPKSEYDELKIMLDAAVAGQETLQKALADAKSEVAREFIEACDSVLSLVCEMTGLEMTFFGKYAKLKHKYTEGKT